MGFRRIMSIVIRGQRWEVGFGYPNKTNGRVNDGLCHYEQKRIIIHSKKNGRKCSLADAVFHEVAHARFPDLNEDSITELGEIASRVFTELWKDEEKLSVKKKK